MKNIHFEPYIYIWESEIQFICALAVMSGFIETGGECYGYLSHAGRPIILFVTPPGPNAIHEKVHFRQDIDFLNYTNRFLVDHYGLNFLGTYHSHHTLGLEGLSLRDINSTQAIANRNNFHYMSQLLVTFTNERSSSNRGVIQKESRIGANRRQYSKGNDIYSVKLHSFFFKNAQNDQPIPCPLKVINGTSPFREMICKNTKIPELHKTYEYPTEKIYYDSFEDNNSTDKKKIDLPQGIVSGISSLPETIADNMGLSLIEDLLILSLPLPKDDTFLTIAYDTKPLCILRAATIFNNGKNQDIMEMINDQKEPIFMAAIYHQALRISEFSKQLTTEIMSEKNEPEQFQVSFGI